ncbi:sigma-54-dependent Fis family transcriptional regulator [Candidatus Poribacteria bacterium]|nr:sigma-54-dependent Fis family transcriptional regulator [Candidatus Poribacteria bacterium]
MSSTYPNGTILIVEDEIPYWTHYQRKLAPLGFRFETAICPKEAREVLKRTQPDLILLDLRFENESPDEGLDFLSQILEQNRDIKVIVVTAATERQTALEAVRRGASDFIEKGSVGFLDALQFRVQAVFERLQLERQIKAQREREIDRIGGYPYGAGQIIVGTSSPMRRVYHFIDRVAQIDETVLIQGESGTGKELIAQAIHYHSQRSKGLWIPINCAAIPAELIEDELFGHRRGAFSGATEDRKGAFEAADGGTIFLDEIGEMPLPLQPRLLRVLQEKKIKRIGENEERAINARVVAATNRNLEMEIEKGNFREDLFFRLNAFSVKLPPLRERREDIPLLIHHLTNLLSQQYNLYKRFTVETINRMVEHDWPGNIRELKDMIQRAIVFADGAEISTHDLDFTPSSESTMSPINPTGNLMPSSPKSETDVRPYKEVRCVLEAWYVGEVLKLTQGNQTRAALLLGIDRNTVRRILTRREGLQL